MPPDPRSALPPRFRVMVLGATGTIGRATVEALAARGHAVVAVVRPGGAPAAPAGVEVRAADVTAPGGLARDGVRGERLDAVVSCLASRTGAPKDAWAIDHAANLHALEAARDAGASRFVLLSAICVQKPVLAFQHAKLAFEAALQASELDHAIVRPTAYFKSLCGQVERVKRGKPFLVFGDGALTACKPIADEDMAAYLADRLDDPPGTRAILPIGGPGPAITPREQGERLFALLGRPARFRSAPVGMLDAVAAGLGVAARAWPPLAEKAELAKIGRYYAAESMLAWDPAAGRYNADATPETGSRTLFDAYAEIVAGAPAPMRGAHAVFKDHER